MRREIRFSERYKTRFSPDHRHNDRIILFFDTISNLISKYFLKTRFRIESFIEIFVHEEDEKRP